MSSSPATGIFLLVASMGAFSLSDALVQYAGSSLPPAQLAWLRYSLLLLTVLPLLARQPRLWRSSRPWVQVGRALGLVGSALLFLQGLKSLPIADATALVFASPLYVTVLSVLLLREPFSLIRAIPVLMGFVGVLIIALPGQMQFNPAVLYPMSSSLGWAAAVICTRLLGNSDSAITTMLYSSALGVVVLTPPSGTAQLAAVIAHWPALLAMAACWCAAQWLVVLAYRHAPPASIAPFSYSQLLWAGLLGRALFGHLPSTRTAIGMALILVSGCLAAWMTRRSVTNPAGHGDKQSATKPC